MNTSEIWRLILLVIGSIGGASVIIVGLASWLGKIWADRLLEKQKAVYAQDLEKLKQQLTIENEQRKIYFDLTRNQSQRYTETKFNLYLDLWNKLQDLKLVADLLWHEATKETLAAFVGSLIQVRVALEKASIVIDKEHFEQLREIISVFENFRLGKSRLVDIRSQRDFLEAYNMEGGDNISSRSLQIRYQIEQNWDYKQQYERLLDKIRVELHGKLAKSQSDILYQPTKSTSSDDS